MQRDGHLTCPTCKFRLMRKGEPGYDEVWAAKVQKEEYWQVCPPSGLVHIDPPTPREPGTIGS